MTDSPKLSRRDWFRLRFAGQEGETRSATSNETASVGPATDSLQSIPLPENHDGLDLSTLPPMREALLTIDQVRQLFADIEELATDILLMQRASPSTGARDAQTTSAVDLGAAQTALFSGNVTRLQLRYRWQNAAWIDTVESRADGFRLVRISH